MQITTKRIDHATVEGTTELYSVTARYIGNGWVVTLDASGRAIAKGMKPKSAIRKAIEKLEAWDDQEVVDWGTGYKVKRYSDGKVSRYTFATRLSAAAARDALAVVGWLDATHAAELEKRHS